MKKKYGGEKQLEHADSVWCCTLFLKCREKGEKEEREKKKKEEGGEKSR